MKCLYFCLIGSLFTSLCQGVGAASTWHVAHNGTDGDTCGTLNHPCWSISQAIQHSLDGDVIAIHANSNAMGDNMFSECSNFMISKSLALTGHGGLVNIGCRTTTRSSYERVGIIFHVLPPTESSVNVIFENVQFINGYIYVSHGTVSLQSCSLVDAAIRSTLGCRSVTLSMHNTSISISEQLPAENTTQYDTSFFCQHITANLTRTTVSDVNVNFEGQFSCHVYVDNCILRKVHAFETGMGGINVSVAQENGSVRVTNSLFDKITHFNPIQSSINIESSVLRIESHRSVLHTHINATIYISDSIFRDNERAVSISRYFKNISIRKCRFEHNVVMHAAAAVRLAIGQNDHVHFDDVIFDGNAAGHNRHASVPDKFEYDGFQIRIREKKVNGIISLVGKGGAVRIHRGKIKFTNCIFRNNTASLLGGAIFVAKNGTVLLHNCSFMNSYTGIHAMQGDMIYSSGNITVTNSTFLTQTAMDHISVLRHSGDPWSMNVKSLWFECPVGYRLVMVNTTSHRVEAMVGLIRSNKLDQLYYYCQTCGNNQYSTNRGSVNFTVTTTVDHFYTLMINGSQPFESHPVDYKFGNITCRECPYGGDCEGDIRAVANFWGYTYNERVSFQHCPPDYCCTSMHCSGVDECAPHRHGRLCGRCINGYSESLFASVCVPNTDCGNYWVWAALGVMGLIYTIFLISQKELRDFVASGNWNFIRCRQRRKEKVTDIAVERECAEMLSRVDAGTLDTTANHEPETVIQPDVEDKDTQDTEEAALRSAGTLIILFYYFQDSLLLHMETIYTQTVSKLVKRLKNILVGLFWFRLDFFQFMESVCIFPDLQPTEKLLFKALFVPYVLFLLGLVFVIHRVISRISSSCRSPRLVTGDPTNKPTPNMAAAFSCRLASGFTLAMLFTYQKMATTTFALLNCVPIGNVSVLRIDGSRECFEVWQYGVMLYAGICVGPFCLILMLGPPLLKQKIISVFDFCVGCLMPLPSLMYWTYRYLRVRTTSPGQVINQIQNINYGERSSQDQVDLAPEAVTIIEVLQGPFKDSTSKRLIGQLCWAGVLVGRRLILFVCYTFINDVLVRLLCMICVCFIILLHHMYVRPYKIRKANLAGAFSASALLIVGTINLIRACFEAAEYIPQGPYKTLMEVCEKIENTLVLWLPLVGVSLILLSILIRCLAAIFTSIFPGEKSTEI